MRHTLRVISQTPRPQSSRYTPADVAFTSGFFLSSLPLCPKDFFPTIIDTLVYYFRSEVRLASARLSQQSQTNFLPRIHQRLRHQFLARYYPHLPADRITLLRCQQASEGRYSLDPPTSLEPPSSCPQPSCHEKLPQGEKRIEKNRRVISDCGFHLFSAMRQLSSDGSESRASRTSRTSRTGRAAGTSGSRGTAGNTGSRRTNRSAGSARNCWRSGNAGTRLHLSRRVRSGKCLQRV